MKIIGGVIRCLNQKLWHHTSADSDFCAFIPTQRGSFEVEMSPKNRFLEQHLTLRVSKNFSVQVNPTLWVLERYPGYISLSW